MSKETVPGYSLLRLLGRGGMGAVYLALRTEDNRQVALKVARTSLGEHGLARLRREAELLSRLQCPYLPSFVEAREVGEQFLLAMDFVRGDPLQIYVVEDVPAEERLEMLRRALPGIAHGLLALHQVGIVHRDLKPANVIINPRRSVLVDLGLARGPDVMTLTKTGVSVGTPEYLPPEQISGELAGPPADLYQVGLIARDLLLGSRRTPGQDMIQEAMKRAISRPEDLRATAPWIPPELAEWIRASLHPTPAGRPDTSEHLQRLIHLCKQPLLPAAEAQGTAAMTWLGSPAHEKVIAARKQAEAQGWPEGQDAPAVPSWAAGEPKAAVAPAPGGKAAAAPVSAPAAPAPAPARSTWVLAALGVVLGLGVGLGFGGRTSQPVASAGTKQEIVLSREGDRLVLLEGPEDLRIVEPEVLSFERDSTGRRTAAARTGPARLESSEGSWELRVPSGGGPSIDDLGSNGLVSMGHLANTAESVSIRLKNARGLFEFETNSDGWFVVPPGALAAEELVLSRRLGNQVWLESRLEVSSLLRSIQDRIEPLPPVPQTGTESLAALNTDRLSWMNRNGARLKALLESEQLDEDFRQQTYLELVSSLREERQIRSSPRQWHWHVANSLGRDLQLQDRPGTLVDPSLAQLGRELRLLPVSLRLGRPGPSGSETVVDPERGSKAILETLPGGGRRIRVPGFPLDRPLACEVSIHGTSFEANGLVEIALGGHRLLLPADQDRGFWLSQRIPPGWFRAALDRDGELEFELRLAAASSPNFDARINSVSVVALYRR